MQSGYGAQAYGQRDGFGGSVYGGYAPSQAQQAPYSQAYPAQQAGYGAPNASRYGAPPQPSMASTYAYSSPGQYGSQGGYGAPAPGAYGQPQGYDAQGYGGQGYEAQAAPAADPGDDHLAAGPENGMPRVAACPPLVNAFNLKKLPGFDHGYYQTVRGRLKAALAQAPAAGEDAGAAAAQAEAAALRAEVAKLRAESERAKREATTAREGAAEVERLRKENQELRGEVQRLRTAGGGGGGDGGEAAAERDALKAQLSKAKAEIQSLQERLNVYEGGDEDEGAGNDAGAEHAAMQMQGMHVGEDAAAAQDGSAWGPGGAAWGGDAAGWGQGQMGGQDGGAGGNGGWGEF